MKAFVHQVIEFAGQSYGPGVIDIDESVYHALSQRGPVRPATQAEIETAAGQERALAEAGPEAPEQAALVPDTQTAAVARPRRSPRTLSHV